MTEQLAMREAAFLRAQAYELTDRATELEGLAGVQATFDEVDLPGVDAGGASQPIARPKLAIIVGHQRTAPGAHAVHPINQHEYEWCGDLAMRIAETSHKEGVATRIFKRDLGGIRGAYGRVRDWEADAAIELHFNSFSESSTGVETLTLVDVPGELDFATAVQVAMVSTLGLRDRGVKDPHPKRGAVALGQLAVPHILVEPFFGSNPNDAAVAHARKDALAVNMAVAAVLFLKGQVG
ncbi:N-acetylmuramoyl-L-alanine amidase [Pyruvatibacter sp.]